MCFSMDGWMDEWVGRHPCMCQRPPPNLTPNPPPKNNKTGRELDPYDGRAYIGLARIELRRRNASAARLIYEDGLRFCGDNPFVLQAYGVFQQKQGDLRRAMDLYDAAIKFGPKHSAAWLAKAQLLWELGRKREARECFQVGGLGFGG